MTRTLYRAAVVAAILGVFATSVPSSSTHSTLVAFVAAAPSPGARGGAGKNNDGTTPPYRKPRHEWKSNVPPTVPMDKQSLKRRWRDRLLQKSGAKKRLMQRRASGAAEAARAAAISEARRRSRSNSLIRKRREEEEAAAVEAEQQGPAPLSPRPDAAVDDTGLSATDDASSTGDASSFSRGDGESGFDDSNTADAQDVDDAFEEEELPEQASDVGGSMTVVGGRGRRHEGIRSGVNSHTQHVHGPGDDEAPQVDL